MTRFQQAHHQRSTSFSEAWWQWQWTHIIHCPTLAHGIQPIPNLGRRKRQVFVFSPSIIITVLHSSVELREKSSVDFNSFTKQNQEKCGKGEMWCDEVCGKDGVWSWWANVALLFPCFLSHVCRNSGHNPFHTIWTSVNIWMVKLSLCVRFQIL